MCQKMNSTQRVFRSDAIKRNERYLAFDRRSFEGPLDLEIGCGVGFHPIHYCQSHPDRFLIALERTRTKAHQFFKRIQNHALLMQTPLQFESEWELRWKNLWAIHADALFWCSAIQEKSVFDRIYLLYPNPEPKNKAQRWFRMPFFGFLMGRVGCSLSSVLR
jgi:tRNA G46 methylase TrmB